MSGAVDQKKPGVITLRPRGLREYAGLVDRDDRVVLLDFGLVHHLEDSLSSAECIAGTVSFMAPEQIASRPIGPAADWYAVGVLLFKALTGTLPFKGAPLKIMMDKQTHAPSRPSSLVDGVPEDLDELGDAVRRSPARAQ